MTMEKVYLCRGGVCVCICGYVCVCVWTYETTAFGDVCPRDSRRVSAHKGNTRIDLLSSFLLLLRLQTDKYGSDCFRVSVCVITGPMTPFEIALPTSAPLLLTSGGGRTARM